MKSILLIGLGRFGRHIALKLNALNHQVMAIDHNEERVNALLPFVTNAQIGDSTNEEFLAALGVGNYDACIVAIGDNFQNSLETTYLLKELGARKIIARASKEMQEKFLLRNGADEVVYPEKQLAAWTAIRCSSEHILEYIELDDEYAILRWRYHPIGAAKVFWNWIFEKTWYQHPRSQNKWKTEYEHYSKHSVWTWHICFGTWSRKSSSQVFSHLIKIPIKGGGGVPDERLILDFHHAGSICLWLFCDGED